MHERRGVERWHRRAAQIVTKGEGEAAEWVESTTQHNREEGRHKGEGAEH